MHLYVSVCAKPGRSSQASIKRVENVTKFAKAGKTAKVIFVFKLPFYLIELISFGLFFLLFLSGFSKACKVSIESM